MNDNTSDQVIDGLNLPANKKAKAKEIQLLL